MDEKLDLLGRLAQRGRDILAIGALLVAVFGVGWVFTGNIFVRRGAAELAGVNDLRIAIETSLATQTKAIDALQYTYERFNEQSELTAMKREDLIRDLNDKIKNLDDRINQLNKSINTNIDPSPAIRFMSTGNSISDGVIGDRVRITYNFIKLRDCGASRPIDILMDINGVLANFEDVSIVDATGQGLLTPVDPTNINRISYTAVIPDHAGLVPGLAQGWVNITYDSKICPGLGVIQGPHIPFNILPTPK